MTAMIKKRSLKTQVPLVKKTEVMKISVLSQELNMVLTCIRQWNFDNLEPRNSNFKRREEIFELL